MTICVVGGTGVLGRRVTTLLARAGHSVRATARTPKGAALIRRLGASAVDVDIFDPVALRPVVAGCDAVCRLTTKIPPLMKMRSARQWQATGRLRNAGAEALVDACLAEGVGTYLHESITFLYASGEDGWVTEDSRIDALSPGSVLDQALGGEAHARRFTVGGGRGVVLRFAGFYAADSSQSEQLAVLARRGWLAAVGPSVSWFSSIHLDDAAEATLAALRAPAGVYNVADEQPLRLVDYLETVRAAAGAQPPIRRLHAFLGPVLYGVAWPYLTRSLRIRAARLHQATGWRPRFSSATEGWRQIAADWAARGAGG